MKNEYTAKKPRDDKIYSLFLVEYVFILTDYIITQTWNGLV